MPKDKHKGPSKQLLDKIAALPMKPGVYLFKDENHEIIYVGKAVRLKSRVRSYFRQDKRASAKTKVLVSKIADLDYAIVSSELEALVLENNFIKKNRPKYNIRLKDDKNYLYLKITKEDFPQLLLVRRMVKDGAKYYGPFTSALAIKRALQLAQKIFPFRKCKHEFFESNDLKGEEAQNTRNPPGVRRCVQYQMGRCLGVCQATVSKQAHDEVIGLVEQFFDGRGQEILPRYRQLMQQAAEQKEYEQAAAYRDRIREIETVLEKQQAVMTDQQDRDVFGLAIQGTKACVQLFKLRRGLLLGKEEFSLDCACDCEPSEVLTRVLSDYYERANEIPREILLPLALEDLEVWQDWLNQIKDQSVRYNINLLFPQRGEKRQVVELASTNAAQRLEELLGEWMSAERRRNLALSELKDGLKLKARPERIECYDISHLDGEGTVGSMVVMQNGQEKKSDYRKFKIKTQTKGDDYLAMQEVLERRFERLLEKGSLITGLTLRQASTKDLVRIVEIMREEHLDDENLDHKSCVVLKHN
ncbi:MAG TPA: excinuclease ABC subunit UvrC, partial [Candidatus Wirthbacteria bacterium]|nr:excinuclease ABC subunit UvrC [Candidatus Wirthbacteria bacterium]